MNDPSKACRTLGHKWAALQSANAVQCDRCKVVRKVVTGWDEVPVEQDQEPPEPTDEELHKLCLWCGKDCGRFE